MFDFDFPQAMRGYIPPENSWTIAQGPFVVEVNGENQLGTQLERNGDEAQYWNGGRPVVFDDSYTTTLHGDQVIAESDLYDSYRVLRPLTLDDATWALPPGVPAPASLGDFTDTVQDMLLSGA